MEDLRQLLFYHGHPEKVQTSTSAGAPCTALSSVNRRRYSSRHVPNASVNNNHDEDHRRWLSAFEAFDRPPCIIDPLDRSERPHPPQTDVDKSFWALGPIFHYIESYRINTCTTAGLRNTQSDSKV